MGEVNSNDKLGRSIIKYVTELNLINNLEIGSWDGTGSTQCFIEGMKPFQTKSLTCLEIINDRYNELVKNTQQYNWIKCLNQSSVNTNKLILQGFDNIWNSPFNKIPHEKEVVYNWYLKDIEVMQTFKEGFLELDTTKYDAVLIDGGEFTGLSEFKLLVNRTNVFFLDDYYSAYKTREVAKILEQDDKWICIECDMHLRNGYAVFKRKLFI